MDSVIEAENLSKKYTIGSRKKAQIQSVSDVLMSKMRSVKQRFADPFSKASQQKEEEEFWALQDLSFSVKAGETVGIIGRNGAGKSTLLKIISRITEPTTGRVTIRGRVASLLEVGTGFHPELTGRENIFLNGAILGMTKVEINQKFDGIVDFAGVEKFLDTPVKRYSSGMYVRLAFAVAAHLEPELLVVDEVLAVGDAEFQKKCLGKMGEFSESGRTVLFVSHNMSAIKAMCSRAILLESGKIVEDGGTVQVIQRYFNKDRVTACRKEWSENKRPGNDFLRLVSVALKKSENEYASEFDISENIYVEITFEVLGNAVKPQFSLGLSDAEGGCVFSSLSNTKGNTLYGVNVKKGLYRTTCELYGHLLNNGRYYITIVCFAGYWNNGFRVDHVLSFESKDDGVLKRDYYGNYGGVIRPNLQWVTELVG
jgi:homopolymeric O-antigen transport system ATP-binding protein